MRWARRGYVQPSAMPYGYTVHFSILFKKGHPVKTATNNDVINVCACVLIHTDEKKDNYDVLYS